MQHLPRGDFHHRDLLQHLRQLNTIGANILKRGGPCGTRNQRQVFQPLPTLLYGPGYQIIPVDPGTRCYPDMGVVFFDLDHAINRKRQGQPRQIPIDHQIAALTNHENRLGQISLGKQLPERIQSGGTRQMVGFGR